MDRLKVRSDFLRASAGIRRVTPGVTLELCSARTQTDGIRVGFTATKKLGNAVIRNRAKRRLRAVAAAVLPLCGVAGNDYVLVARRDTLTRPFDGLVADLKAALNGAHEKQARTRTEGQQ